VARQPANANSFFEESAMIRRAETLFLERGRDKRGVVAAKTEGVI
jgi:hypothetical protein